MKHLRLLFVPALLLLLAACVDPQPAQNLAPKAVITASPADSAPVGTVITLDGTESIDPDGEIVSYTWLIDGVFHSNGGETTFTLEKPDHHYEISLTVTDDGGRSGEANIVYHSLPNDDDNDTDPNPSTEGSVKIIRSPEEDERGIVLNYGDEYDLNIEVSESWELSSSASWLSFEQVEGDKPEGGAEAEHTVRLEFLSDQIPPEQDFLVATINLIGLESDTSDNVGIVVNLPELDVAEGPLVLRKAVKRTEVATFEIDNPALVAPLTFAVSNAPEWLTFDAPFGTVSGGSMQVATVHATCDEVAGLREGVITLTTNDPRAESYDIKVELDCIQPPVSEFHIELLDVGEEPFTPSEWEIALAAAERWSEVITGDLEDVLLDAPAPLCGTDYPTFSGRIDDIVIYVEKGETGGYAGLGGYCALRDAGSPHEGLPYAGHVIIQPSPWAGPLGRAELEHLFMHEFAHALGFGTLWDSRLDIVDAGGTYIGSEASKQYGLLLGGAPVSPPLDSDGGDRTAGLHWDGQKLGFELMEGAGGPLSRLSRVTIGAMADLGYQIDPDYTVADTYAPPPPGATPLGALQRLNFSGDTIR